MALQFRRYPCSQGFAFDFGGSIRCATLAMGGDWENLGDALWDEVTAAQLQPLARIDNNAERALAQDWMAGLLVREGISVDPEARDHLWSNLTSLSSARVEECTLTGLSVLLQSTDVKRALAPFCLGGPFGRLLDAEVEELGSANVLAFENEGRIESAAAPAVLGYLFHRIEARLDGRPTMIVIDEGWLALDDASFGGQLTTFHHGEDHAGFVIIIPILNHLEKPPEISLIDADGTGEIAIDVRTINELDFKFLDSADRVRAQACQESGGSRDAWHRYRCNQDDYHARCGLTRARYFLRTGCAPQTVDERSDAIVRLSHMLRFRTI